ncbi:MAG: hypothetical protein IJU91_05610 [Selenomonadaceae bacterium]|nr:hypothetical protein [Selenomonadaceae bacterium]
MKFKIFLTAAIICAALTFGISSTTSAAELSSDFATMQVESQVLSNRSRRIAPVPPPPPPRHRYDRDRDRYDDYRRTGYSNSRRYSKPKTTVRRVNINISVTRRV